MQVSLCRNEQTLLKNVLDFEKKDSSSCLLICTTIKASDFSNCVYFASMALEIALFRILHFKCYFFSWQTNALNSRTCLLFNLLKAFFWSSDNLQHSFFLNIFCFKPDFFPLGCSSATACHQSWHRLTEKSNSFNVIWDHRYLKKYIAQGIIVGKRFTQKSKR